MENNRKYIEGLIISDSLFNFKNHVTLSDRDLHQYIFDYAYYISELKKDNFFNDAVKLRKVLKMAIMIYGVENDRANNLIDTYTLKHYEG